MEEVPLFGNMFDPIEVPELSIESKTSKIPQLPDIGKTDFLTQAPLDIKFPLFNPVDFKSKTATENLSLQDRIGKGLDKINDSSYRGSISQIDATLYNDPVLGYSESRNNEDVYSSKGNWYNAQMKFNKDAKNWLYVNTIGLKEIFNAAAEGNFDKIVDNEMNREMAADSEAMQYLYPIYKSKAAQDNPWNVFATGNLESNYANLGMIAGTIVGTIAQDIAIAGVGALATPLTGGAAAAASSGAIALTTAKNFGQIFKQINNIAKTFSSVKAAKNVAQAVKDGQNLATAIKGAAIGGNVFKTSAQIIKNTLVASGEAGFEAYQTYEGVKNKLLAENPDADINDVLKTAHAAGNLAYGLNQTVLNFSNAQMYGRLLTGKLMTNTLKDLPLEILADKANGTLSMITKGSQNAKSYKNLWNFSNTYGGHYAKTLLTNSFGALEGLGTLRKKGLRGLTLKLGEGAEEGLQFAIQNGTDAYYKDKFSGKAESIVNYAGKGLGSMFSDEGKANIAGGAFIGGGMGIAGQALNAATRGKTASDLSYSDYHKQIKDYREEFERTTKLFNHAAKTSEDIDIENGGLYEVKTKLDDYVHDFALFGIRQGNIEARIDAIKEFKDASFEAFNNLVPGAAKSVEDIPKVVDSIVKQIKVTQDSFQEIESAYGVNPFVNEDFYKNAISKLASKQKQTEKAISASLWEMSKDQAIKVLVDYKNGTDRNRKLTDEVIKGFTSASKIKDEHVPLFEAFLNSPVMGLNKGYQNAQNEEFSNQLKYMLDTLKESTKTQEELIAGLGELTSVLGDQQTLGSPRKFYEGIKKHFENGNLKDFYTDFFKYVTGVPEGEDINEQDLNHFIINTSDIIKLRMGKQFLSADLKKLQTREGQKQLVKRNLENLDFYTYLEDLKAKVEEGVVVGATVTREGEEPTVIGTPSTGISTPTTAIISENDYKEFIDNNVVSDTIILNIARRIIDKQSLTKEEIAIQSKEPHSTKIEEKIKELTTPPEVNLQDTETVEKNFDTYKSLLDKDTIESLTNVINLLDNYLKSFTDSKYDINLPPLYKKIKKENVQPLLEYFTKKKEDLKKAQSVNNTQNNSNVSVTSESSELNNKIEELRKKEIDDLNNIIAGNSLVVNKNNISGNRVVKAVIRDSDNKIKIEFNDGLILDIYTVFNNNLNADFKKDYDTIYSKYDKLITDVQNYSNVSENIESSELNTIEKIEEARNFKLKNAIESVERKTNKNRQPIDVGVQYKEGLIVLIESFDIPYAKLSKKEYDMLSEEDKIKYSDNPYQIVIEVLSEAEFGQDGKMTKAASVKVASFKNKKEADNFLQERKLKIEKRLQEKTKEINNEHDKLITTLKNTQSTTNQPIVNVPVVIPVVEKTIQVINPEYKDDFEIAFTRLYGFMTRVPSDKKQVDDDILEPYQESLFQIIKQVKETLVQEELINKSPEGITEQKILSRFTKLIFNNIVERLTPVKTTKKAFYLKEIKDKIEKHEDGSFYEGKYKWNFNNVKEFEDFIILELLYEGKLGISIDENGEGTRDSLEDINKKLDKIDDNIKSIVTFAENIIIYSDIDVFEKFDLVRIMTPGVVFDKNSKEYNRKKRVRLSKMFQKVYQEFEANLPKPIDIIVPEEVIEKTAEEKVKDVINEINDLKEFAESLSNIIDLKTVKIGLVDNFEDIEEAPSYIDAKIRNTSGWIEADINDGRSINEVFDRVSKMLFQDVKANSLLIPESKDLLMKYVDLFYNKKITKTLEQLVLGDKVEVSKEFDNQIEDLTKQPETIKVTVKKEDTVTELEIKNTEESLKYADQLKKEELKKELDNLNSRFTNKRIGQFYEC